GGIKRKFGRSLFHAGWEVKRSSRLRSFLWSSAYLRGPLRSWSLRTQRAAEKAGHPPCHGLCCSPCSLSAVYTVGRAELFPRLVLHIENLVFKDDRKQLLRHFIVY